MEPRQREQALMGTELVEALMEVLGEVSEGEEQDSGVEVILTVVEGSVVGEVLVGDTGEPLVIGSVLPKST